MSQSRGEKAHDRREFLRTAGRLAVACGLGGGVLELIAGKGRRCSTPSSCAHCAALQECRLPAAVEFRAEAAVRKSG